LFLAAPRSDTPQTLVPTAAAKKSAAARKKAFDATKAAPDDVMSEMALQWRKATAGLPGAPPVVTKPTTQDEVHLFLRQQVQVLLDHRAKAAN